jgi:hypothetical protein
MTILYFGNYNPNYSRNRVLIRGLRENGVKVVECNVKRSGFLSLFFLLLNVFGKIFDSKADSF